MKEALQNILRQVVSDYARKKEISLPDAFQIEIEISRDRGHGDLSTPVAFRLVRWIKEKPATIANEILILFEQTMSKDK